MSYYFAYGSNMNQQQMRERCPDSVLVGRVVLRDHTIDFTIFAAARQCGCADIVEREGHEVWGLLYEVSDADVAFLDRFEGHPTCYQRCAVEVADDHGRMYSAFAYEVVNKTSTTLPSSKHYLGLILGAAEEHSFPEPYRQLLGSFSTLD